MKNKPSDQLMEILFLVEADALPDAHILSRLSLAFIQIAANKMGLADGDTYDIKEAWYILGYAADLAEAEGW